MIHDAKGLKQKVVLPHIAIYRLEDIHTDLDIRKFFPRQEEVSAAQKEWEYLLCEQAEMKLYTL